MRYVTATIGAIFILVAVFLVTMSLTPFLPVGFIIAILVAVSSFRATLQYYKKKDQENARLADKEETSLS